MNPNLPRGVTSMTTDQTSSKLELFISAKNLADLDFITVTDSFLIIKLSQPNKPEITLLKTKIYWNDLNPNYDETVTIEYVFEIRQKLKFQVYHEAYPPKLVGKVQATLGEIFSAPNNELIRDLLDHKSKKSGQIVVRFQIVEQATNNLLQFSLQGSNFPSVFQFFCCGTNDRSFYRIFRQREKDELLIYQSQVAYGKQPRFEPCKLSERRLCKNKPNNKFEFRFFSHNKKGNHSQIGIVSSSVNEILKSQNIPIFKKGQRTKNCISFENVHRPIQSTFADYMVSGLQLMLITCIDFTASNGAPNSPSSLHYVSPNKKSTYEQALEEVSRILLDYDYDKQVPVYGFGAKVAMPNFNSQKKVHHCFPLNGNQNNSHVYMVEGIMRAYRAAIKYLEFSGPTYFNVILNQAIQQCYEIKNQASQLNQYMIVFILTDGQIHDKQKVIDQIIQCCSLPISIIIVGVGDGPFDIMNVLDDDDCQLIDSKDRKTTRDLVQFVEFRKFRNNGVELAKQVLEQLPRQVEEYYQMMNIEPERLRELQPPQNPMAKNNMGGGIDMRDVGPFREAPYFSGNNGY